MRETSLPVNKTCWYSVRTVPCTDTKGDRQTKRSRPLYRASALKQPIEWINCCLVTGWPLPYESILCYATCLPKILQEDRPATYPSRHLSFSLATVQPRRLPRWWTTKHHLNRKLALALGIRTRLSWTTIPERTAHTKSVLYFLQ